jgi:flagellar motor protein MotB
MFWLKRLKSEELGTPWELSYADLMSLLMAVFVLIASMGELRNGKKFGSVSKSMRAALGFNGALESPEEAQDASFLAQLRKAGLRSDGLVPRGTDAEVLAPCEVVSEGEQTIIRIAGSASFDASSSQLKITGRKALLRIAQFLMTGHNAIEIRTYSGAAAGAGDSMDLAYQRARVVVEIMKQSGVSGERLRLSAGGDTTATPAGSDNADRRIEIVLYSVSPASTDSQIAEKEQH